MYQLRECSNYPYLHVFDFIKHYTLFDCEVDRLTGRDDTAHGGSRLFPTYGLTIIIIVPDVTVQTAHKGVSGLSCINHQKDKMA